MKVKQLVKVLDKRITVKVFEEHEEIWIPRKRIKLEELNNEFGERNIARILPMEIFDLRIVLRKA